MTHNKTKLAIFDIDDTLILRGETTIKESAYRAIQALEAKGVQVMIATGRSYYFIHDDIFNRVNPDYIVTVNGSLVYNKKREHIVYITFKRDEVASLIEVCRANNIAIAGKMLDSMHVYHGLDTFLSVYLKGSPKAYILEDYQTTELGDELPMGLFLIGDEAFIESLKDTYPGVVFAKAYTNAYDIYSKDAGKIRGIEKVLSQLGISWEETIAFGDAFNDIDMLTHAGIGVAMGNGIDALKEIADFVTKDINEDGIEYALKTLNLID